MKTSSYKISILTHYFDANSDHYHYYYYYYFFLTVLSSSIFVFLASINLLSLASSDLIICKMVSSSFFKSDSWDLTYLPISFRVSYSLIAIWLFNYYSDFFIQYLLHILLKLNINNISLSNPIYLINIINSGSPFCFFFFVFFYSTPIVLRHTLKYCCLCQAITIILHSNLMHISNCFIWAN